MSATISPAGLMSFTTELRAKTYRPEALRRRTSPSQACRDRPGLPTRLSWLWLAGAHRELEKEHKGGGQRHQAGPRRDGEGVRWEMSGQRREEHCS